MFFAVRRLVGDHGLEFLAVSADRCDEREYESRCRPLFEEMCNRYEVPAEEILSGTAAP